LPKSPPQDKQPLPTKIDEESYDDLNDYMPTEYLDGCINLKVHPNCLTGAKGFETSYNFAESLEYKDDDEEFEDLLAGQTIMSKTHFRSSDNLE
jgi:hypothetical protein